MSIQRLIFYYIFFISTFCFSKNAYLVYIDSTHGPGAFGHMLFYPSDVDLRQKNLNLKNLELPGSIYNFYIEISNDQFMNWDNIFEFRSKSRFIKQNASETITDYNIRQNREVYFYELNLSPAEVEQLENLYQNEIDQKIIYSRFSYDNSCASNAVRFINSIVDSDRHINQHINDQWIFNKNKFGIWNSQAAFYSTFSIILNYDLKSHAVIRGEPIHFPSKEVQLIKELNNLKKQMHENFEACQSDSVFKYLVNKTISNQDDFNSTQNIIEKCSNADAPNQNRNFQFSDIKKILENIRYLSNQKSIPKVFFNE